MPMKLSEKAWSRWETTIQRLHHDFEFPAETHDALSGFFSLSRGEGSTFRLETDCWKMVIDVIRTGDDIIDIAAITLASKLDLETMIRGGWVITARCPYHPQPKASSQKSSANISSDDSDLFWYRIEEGGRLSTHCCKQECVGPFKASPWKVFDAARQGIVIKTLEHKVIQLLSSDKSIILEETEDSALKEQLAKAVQEKEELQAKYDAMIARLSQADDQISEMRADKAFRAWARLRKQLDATKQQERSLQIKLHEALQEIETLKRGDSGTSGCLSSSHQEGGAEETLGKNTGKGSQGLGEPSQQSQPLSNWSHHQGEVVDLTSEAGPSDTPPKSTGMEGEAQSEIGAPRRSSRPKRKPRKPKRALEPAALDEEDEAASPRKRRSKSQGDAPKTKTEPEV
ncbi:hypothetical protein F5X68DRAFT_274320 [Plectosphaerella plurivora]|uniref:Uncharacterized protein n=1 Tax=Plectosphaerella plurivora TaxID=936078 RepID=A0A9P8VHH0_9PEZI|nr:hypothetical protein F5X68DRAFT_274320 [Plectosphaerella plurivora]